MDQHFEQQSLIDFLEKEREKRGLEVSEFAPQIGLSKNEYYNIRNGKRAGLQTCLDIARNLKLRADYVLFLAGYIDEDELNAPQQIPAELLPVIQKLAQMKGTPFFDTALSLVEKTIEDLVSLFKKAA